MPPVWAEGGLWSSAADLASWISFQLRAYREPAATSPVLAAGSLREMHKPRYLADDQWTRAWGISWCGTRRDEVTWIGHDGGIPGFTSTICFDPVSQVGAVVLVNGTIGSAATAAESPGWQVVLTPTADPDRFAAADGGSVLGDVTFRRPAGGRVVSAFFLDCTWVRLDRVTA